MIMEAYIGNFDDPNYDFYGGDYNGNIPHRQSPFFPYPHGIFDALSKTKSIADYEVRQLDWGAIGAKMSKQQLEIFIDSFADEKSFKDIRQFIQGLDADKTYVLVAFETGEDYN